MVDFNFDIDLKGLDFDIPLFEHGFNNRYIKPKIGRELKDYQIKYENAKKLAKDLKLAKDMRYACIVSGNFIFGDFIEAFIVENNLYCENLIISTLSLDQNNVDSLQNLVDGDFVKEMNLVISDYFYAHERNSLVPYIYEHLDKDNIFQLAVAGSHTKVVLIESGNYRIVMHGSANLRSSSCLEQFVIEDSKELYDSWSEYHNRIIDKFKTINKEVDIKKQKALRNKKLWQAVQDNTSI